MVRTDTGLKWWGYWWKSIVARPYWTDSAFNESRPSFSNRSEIDSWFTWDESRIEWDSLILPHFPIYFLGQGFGLWTVMKYQFRCSLEQVLFEFRSRALIKRIYFLCSTTGLQQQKLLLCMETCLPAWRWKQRRAIRMASIRREWVTKRISSS